MTDNKIVPLGKQHRRSAPDAEEAFIGSLIFDWPNAWPKVAGRLQRRDFYRGDLQVIYGAMCAMAAQNVVVDVITLADHMQRFDLLSDIGGLAALGKLARDTPTAQNILGFAAIIEDKSRIRGLEDIGRQIANAVSNGDTSQTILDRTVLKLESLNATVGKAVEPLLIEPASLWADRAPPPPRDCVVEGLAIHARRVVSFIGNGGLGKSLTALQIGVAVVTGTPIWGMPVTAGAVVGFLCEDEQDEVERRTRRICEAQQIDLALLDNLHLLSRDGEDNILANFDKDLIQLTATYWRLDAALALIRPRLTIIDTAADVFAGDFISTTHVRQFIKIALGGLCKRHETAILLLAHPSASAMNSGDGGGFSTAWNNSVRSRLYLRSPKTDDKDEAADRRVLEVKKSNYGPSGGVIPLVYERGQFVLDPDPVEEASKPKRVAKTNTREAVGVMAYFTANASSGQPVGFRVVFDAMRAAGHVPQGEYEKVRKPLYRTLAQLVDTGLLKACEVPKGYYRMVRPEALY